MNYTTTAGLQVDDVQQILRQHDAHLEELLEDKTKEGGPLYLEQIHNIRENA